MKNKTKISVVIPAFNEEEGIASVIGLVPVAELHGLGYETEIIVVDNGSTDRTADLARERGARIIPQPVRGYGNAYQAGFANATGDIIATGDADMTYPLDALPELLAEFDKAKADFSSMDRLSRLNPEAMTLVHLFGNWLLSATTRILFNWPFRDSQSGMWIFKRSILKHLDMRSGGMPFSQELKIEAYIRGFTCIELPIEYRPRVGKVKLNAIKDGVRNLTQLFAKRVTIMASYARTTIGTAQT